MRVLASLAAAGLIAGTLAVQAQDAPSEMPIPRIETGMHVAPVIRIGVDRDCKLMVTGSKDKTARLWALPSSVDGEAELLQTFRVPLGDGDQGKIFAVAISPNGRIVAVGGWDVFQDQQADHAIYVSIPQRAHCCAASPASAASSGSWCSRRTACIWRPRYRIAGGSKFGARRPGK